MSQEARISWPQVSDNGIKPDPVGGEAIQQLPWMYSKHKKAAYFSWPCNYLLQERARLLNQLTKQSTFVLTVEREAAYNYLTLTFQLALFHSFQILYDETQ